MPRDPPAEFTLVRPGSGPAARLPPSIGPEHVITYQKSATRARRRHGRQGRHQAGMAPDEASGKHADARRSQRGGQSWAGQGQRSSSGAGAGTGAPGGRRVGAARCCPGRGTAAGTSAPSLRPGQMPGGAGSGSAATRPGGLPGLRWAGSVPRAASMTTAPGGRPGSGWRPGSPGATRCAPLHAAPTGSTWTAPYGFTS
jgi:hypothetical protein